MTIDWAKPIELEDGTPAKLRTFDRDGDPIVELPEGTAARHGDRLGDSKRWFLPDGAHILGTLPNIKNRAEA